MSKLLVNQFKEQMQNRFTILFAKSAHGGTKMVSLSKVAICGIFVVHDLPNKHRF